MAQLMPESIPHELRKVLQSYEIISKFSPKDTDVAKKITDIILKNFPKKKKVFVDVKDTGIGMSSKAREKLFEKFYRIQNEKTRAITGTGLGLWITKQIVELMNGTIMVDSIENVGTQITLNFPIVK